MSDARFASATAPGTSRALLNWLQPMLATMTSPAQITARRKKLARLNQSSSGADERHPASIRASSGNGMAAAFPAATAPPLSAGASKYVHHVSYFSAYIR